MLQGFAALEKGHLQRTQRAAELAQTLQEDVLKGLISAHASDASQRLEAVRLMIVAFNKNVTLAQERCAKKSTRFTQVFMEWR